MQRKVLVIGCGSIGSRHARNLRMLGAEVGLFDTDISSMAARLSTAITLMTPFEELHAATAWADAIVIASPAKCHVNHLGIAIGARKPTFIEKPVALTASETVRELAGIADRWEVPVQVGYNLRFHELWRSLRGAVLNHGVGIPDRGDFSIVSNMETWPGMSYADALAECSHEIDQALWMLGPAVCVGAISRDRGYAWDLLLRHEQGAASSVHINTVAHYSARSAAVAGSVSMAGFAWDGGFGREEMYVDEMVHFLDVVNGKASPSCTLKDGIAVLEIMDQARRLAL